MYLRLFAILLAMAASIPGVCGNVIVANSAYVGGVGSISYSISHDGGNVWQMPSENIEQGNNYIFAAIQGCSIQDANSISAYMDAKDCNGDTASVTADIEGPGASVTNYQLFGWVSPNLAWTGQYADYIKGSDITLDAFGENYPWGSNMGFAESKLETNYAYSPVYTVFNWWQDSMAGGYDAWNFAMSDIYSGTAVVDSTNGNDRIDVRTESNYQSPGSSYPIYSWADNYVSQDNFISTNGISTAYSDSAISFSDVDSVTANSGIYSYYYVDLNRGINTGDVIYW
jgi:hypothetical protein